MGLSSDRFVRGLPIGFIIFVIVSEGCATAGTVWSMIGWRVVQAVGACASVVQARTMVCISLWFTLIFGANAPALAAAGSVTFEPCARSAWHSYPMWQTFIVTDGTGLVQQWVGHIEIIRKGDVVWTPPGQKHWHGATATTSMTNTAIQEQIEGRNVACMEKVTDAEYAKQPALLPVVQNMPNQAPVTQKLMGDVAPKLADLTDKVLFGDVWERPDLSKRDRSLAIISALIALNRPNQLRSYVASARDSGVTETEIVETHQSGFPRWLSQHRDCRRGG